MSSVGSADEHPAICLSTTPCLVPGAISVHISLLSCTLLSPAGNSLSPFAQQNSTHPVMANLGHQFDWKWD